MSIKNQAVTITYSSAKAYFSKMGEGFLSIHFPIDDANKELFEYKLQQNEIRVVEWEKLRETERREMMRECGADIHEHRNVSKGPFMKATYQVGKFFGVINRLMTTAGEPIAKKTEELSEKADSVKEEKLSSDTK